MRLIDADALPIWHWTMVWEEGVGIRRCCEAIAAAPTIDPVKHGKWKNKQMLDEELNPTIAFRHRCSECGFEICTTDETIWWHFCPNCGAKVDGGEG